MANVIKEQELNNKFWEIQDQLTELFEENKDASIIFAAIGQKCELASDDIPFPNLLRGDTVSLGTMICELMSRSPEFEQTVRMAVEVFDEAKNGKREE